MKVALFLLVVALVAVPAMCWRYREWNNANCKDDPVITQAYENDKSSCQSALDAPGQYFTFTSDCKKGRASSILRFSDGQCTQRTGSDFSTMGPTGGVANASPDEFWYVSGRCQTNEAKGISWNIDCKEKP
jgi:hypothetical protein